MAKIKLNLKIVRDWFMSYINRAAEELLRSKFKKSKSVAITGARQVGKTTLTKTLFPNVKRINLRNMVLYNAAKKDPDGFLNSFDRPLFIDEVQRVPEVISSAKVLLDEIGGKSNYLFSGSQKWELMKGLSESLAGMVSIMELLPLSMREIKAIHFNESFVPSEDYLKTREKELKPYDNLWKRIHHGFYPELYDEDARDWEDYYQSYVSTYIERDVYDITKVKDYDTFYRFMVSVAARTGNILDYTNIANDVGVSVETVRLWISILEATDVIFLLRPYYNSHLNRAIKTPKIYFRDTGLAAFLTSWLTSETLEHGAMAGAFFETFVVNEIAKSFVNSGKDFSKYVYYYRGKDKMRNKKDGNGEYVECEIDLVIEENGILYPIEIKKNGNPNEHDADAFDVLDKDISKKHSTGAIVCTSQYKIKLRDNLYALPIEYI